MTDANLETNRLEPAPTLKRSKSRLDLWLNSMLIVLLVGVLAAGGWFAYTIYLDKQGENATSAAGRIAAALADQIRKKPNDAVLRVRLGEAYSAMDKFPQAIEQFNAALKINPKHTGAYFDLGAVAMMNERNSDAQHYFEKVISLTDGDQYENVNPTRELAYYNLGIIALAEKRYSDSAGFLKAALRIRKDASDTYYQLAHALRGLGDVDSAITQLEIGLQFDPGFAQAHYYLAELYKQQGDLVNASYQYKKAVDLAPSATPPQKALKALGSASDWLNKAKSKMASGDKDAALNAVLISRNLDPKSYPAAKFHGDLLVQRDQLKDALDVYRQAAAIQPKNAEMKALVASIAGRVSAQKNGAKKAPKASATKSK
jgi:tetratricopeptide (TPR) repeat protein